MSTFALNSVIVSRIECMQFIFGDKREVYLLDESVLPVTKKERRREGKRSIGPWMKYLGMLVVRFATTILLHLYPDHVFSKLNHFFVLFAF